MSQTPGPTRRDLLRAGALAAAGGRLCFGAPRLAAETADDRLAWFREARYGLFVHWGPYSVAGVEASWPIMVPEMAQLLGPDQKISEADYVGLAQRFDPRAFDPRAWVRTVREAGMRYLVITAKHHDGYCLFDAPGTDYKSTKGPAGRDLLAELAEACHAADLPLGFYYSPPDVHHPGYRDISRPATENWQGEPDRPQWAGYLDAMEAQLRKLLTDYGDVAVIWFDGLFEHAKYDPARFHRLVRELSPKTLVNDRLGAELGDYVTPEQAFPEGVPVRREAPAPETTAEQFDQFVRLLTSGTSAEQVAQIFAAVQRMRFPTERLPPRERFQPWESCMTLGVSWGYDPLERDLKSAETVVRTLIEVASRGGNLLLNVGPKPDGTLPQASVEILRRAGEWLAECGEAIYGTEYGPVQGAEGVRTTQTPGGSRRFLIALEPAAGGLKVEGGEVLAGETAPVRARLLPSGPAVEASVAEGVLSLRLPAEADLPKVVAFEGR